MRRWLPEAFAAFAVVVLLETVYASDSRVDQLADRLAAVERSDGEQTRLLLCAVTVDRQVARLLDGLIDEATELEVSGEPDGKACEP